MLIVTAASNKIHTVNCVTATQYATHAHTCQRLKHNKQGHTKQQQQQHLFIQCLQPLQTLQQTGMLPSRFGLPPSQHTLCTTQKVSDGEVAVLSSYVKAHIMTDKGSGQEKLHCGH